MCAECAVVVMDYVIISGHCTPAAATMIFNFVLSHARPGAKSSSVVLDIYL